MVDAVDDEGPLITIGDALAQIDRRRKDRRDVERLRRHGSRVALPPLADADAWVDDVIDEANARDLRVAHLRREVSRLDDAAVSAAYRGDAAAEREWRQSLALATAELQVLDDPGGHHAARRVTVDCLDRTVAKGKALAAEIEGKRDLRLDVTADLAELERLRGNVRFFREKLR